jgi:hypothetical protein
VLVTTLFLPRFIQEKWPVVAPHPFLGFVPFKGSKRKIVRYQEDLWEEYNKREVKNLVTAEIRL